MTEPLTQAEITDYCERVLEIVNHASEATNLRDYLESTKAEPIGFDPYEMARVLRAWSRNLRAQADALEQFCVSFDGMHAEQQKEKN